MDCPSCHGSLDQAGFRNHVIVRCRKCRRFKIDDGEWLPIVNDLVVSPFFANPTKCACGEIAEIAKSQSRGVVVQCKKCSRKKRAAKACRRPFPGGPLRAV